MLDFAAFELMSEGIGSYVAVLFHHIRFSSIFPCDAALFDKVILDRLGPFFAQLLVVLFRAACGGVTCDTNLDFRVFF